MIHEVAILKKGESLGKIKERRLGGDRRTFSFALHIPERRSGVERRTGESYSKDSEKSDQNDSIAEEEDGKNIGMV
jgi:hypothetical protein